MLGFLTTLGWFFLAFCVIIEILGIFLPPFQMARNRLHYWYSALLLFVSTKDFKKRSPRAPSALSPSDVPIRTITYVFVRHGQSRWNSYFNAFDMWWPFRILYLLISETYYFFMNDKESTLIDSPLTEKGVTQARAIMSVVAGVGLHKEKPYRLITSNLRRALETAILCCNQIGTSNGTKKVLIHSDLQEISRNIDALSLCVEGGDPPRELALTTMRYSLYSRSADYSKNLGNKTASSVGSDRIDNFVDWTFSSAQTDPVLYIIGHSGWMRTFFKRYVPEANHNEIPWVSKKLKNCAVVSFDVAKYKSGQVAVIPATVKLHNP